MRTIQIVLIVAMLAFMATAANSSKNVVEDIPIQGADCAICSYLVGKVEHYVAGNLTEKEIIKNLVHDCSLLGHAALECKLAVEAEGPSIINKVIQKESPTAICIDLGKCNATMTANIAAAASAKLSKEARKLKGEIKCTLCNHMVGIVEAGVEGNLTQATIESDLYSYCAALGDIKIICDDLVNIYAPRIIASVENKTNPLAICIDIGLCTATDAATVVKKESKKPAAVVVAKKVGGDTECSLCSYLVSRVEVHIAENMTAHEILDKLKADCKEYAGKESEECKIMVTLYGPKIIAKIEADGNPIDVCTDIHMCRNSTASIMKQLAAAKKVGGEIECTVCSLIVNRAESYFHLKLNETEIISRLEKDCASIFGSPTDKLCDYIVASYGEKIIQKLQRDEDPLVVCHEAGMCSANMTATATKCTKSAKSASKKVGKITPDCMLCEVMVGKIDASIKHKVNETQILDDLLADCATQGFFKGECEHIVNLYGPAIFDRLNSGMSPLVVCKDVGLCTDSKNTKKANKRFSATLAH
ncbi:hypothetical protein SAMD00019534_124700 [Acytostelium subglobosum LB1]|uniref:hypothetical protein n=1 Tax=Acytostelium subglobosum LB1 TaxID=1410327 RepID=UPI000644AC5B|nr:hypothetical protein SAMD00019534_124700 [Acytostelium subglobosum LB1]GAM29294.1 hypothetical protein SAMD00019534_124700 [Acytostelium subglobosum LB1]|eukprot:XP_012747792.1 hypothetical protein SAMD00019534_124700 [Acytostelium subglobosum LB1]